MEQINTLKPNQQRAKNAITLIWVMLTIKIISLLFNYLQFDLLIDIKNGIKISKEEAYINYLRIITINIVYIIFFIISAITFIKWFRRAYYNLHVKMNNLTHEENWATIGWFVPILSLFMPYQIMCELYKKTKSYFKISGNKLNTNSVNLWWTIWIILIISNVTLRHIDQLGSFKIETVKGLIIDGIFIPLALITIKVIKDYSRVEPLLFEIEEVENIEENNPTTENF